MIPSGYKEDVVYSQIPTSGAGDLSFTRASNGTRINSAGLVEVCPWNLLLNTDTFSSWNLEGGTLTSGFTAPDGSSTAYKYVQPTFGSGLWSTLNLPIMSAGTGATLSIWAKSVSGSNVAFYLGSGYSATGGATKTATSEWQLFTVSYAFADGGSMYINNISDTTNGIYLWHPQVNVGLTAKPYFPTTDRLNVPRLTYQNGGGGCPSLLLEKQSTNLFTYSEQFDNAAWTKLNSTITANSTTSPDGTQNADSINDTTSNSRHVIEEPITGDLSLSRAMSLYAKQNTLRYLYMSVTDAGDFNCYSAVFDLQSGIVSATKVNGNATITASIQSVGNGWYRCIITGTMTTGTATFYPLIGTSDRPGFTGTLINNNAPSYSGSGQSLYIWGAQLEASSYPTSYIPTTSASATRVADACYKTGISSLIGQTEGTAFVEIKTAIIDSAGQIILSLDDGTTSNRMEIFALGSGAVGFYIETGGASQANTVSSFTLQNNMKLAFAYKQNDFVLYINGTQVGTDTTGTVPTASAFRLQPNVSGSGFSVKSYGEAVLFKTRLTNAELASLTTI